jgi:NAD(P)-dependent dehydrogenase (short-subunit alcohol dehydrogenase family)
MRSTKFVEPAPFTLNGVEKGSLAVITGGASGIGFETAKRCFSHGMSVAIADIDSKKLEAAEAILRSFDAKEDQKVLACVLDVSDSTQVMLFEQQIRALYADKPITFVLNNAGVVGGMSILNASSQESKSVFNTNVHGVMHVFQAFVHNLVKQDVPCAIVTTSSIAGLLPIPTGVYTASKHAVTAVAECMYHEIKQLDGGHKLSTHVLCPSYVATAMWTSGPHTVTDKDAQAVCDAIHKVAEEKGLSAGEVVTEMFKGVGQGKFFIIANDPAGKGEIEAMVKARANVIADGAAPRQPTQQKVTQEIQKEILSA